MSDSSVLSETLLLTEIYFLKLCFLNFSLIQLNYNDWVTCCVTNIRKDDKSEFSEAVCSIVQKNSDRRINSVNGGMATWIIGLCIVVVFFQILWSDTSSLQFTVQQYVCDRLDSTFANQKLLLDVLFSFIFKIAWWNLLFWSYLLIKILFLCS